MAYAVKALSEAVGRLLKPVLGYSITARKARLPNTHGQYARKYLCILQCLQRAPMPRHGLFWGADTLGKGEDRCAQRGAYRSQRGASSHRARHDPPGINSRGKESRTKKSPLEAGRFKAGRR
jgi:hypothetical protein